MGRIVNEYLLNTTDSLTTPGEEAIYSERGSVVVGCFMAVWAIVSGAGCFSSLVLFPGHRLANGEG